MTDPARGRAATVIDELRALRQSTLDPEVKRVARRALVEIDRLEEKLIRIRRITR